MESGIDAVYLSLHGAFVTETVKDPEGELLKRLRAVPGLASVPIVGVFDLHANFSDDMAEYANALVCYRENPHTDARESAVRSAQLLARALRERASPVMHARNAAILWAPPGTGTADRPMRDLEALAPAARAKCCDRDRRERRAECRRSRFGDAAPGRIG